eukprot:SAG11_NODE_12036_length_725_cov_0.747604_1_plen_47_part_10
MVLPGLFQDEELSLNRHLSVSWALLLFTDGRALPTLARKRKLASCLV